MDTRKIKEKQFHNLLRNDYTDQIWTPELEKVIKEDPLWANMKYYAVERKSRKAIYSWYDNNCKSKRVLDFCCGNGYDSLMLARKGAREVVGIDISEVSIDNCNKMAVIESLEKITSFHVMDAEALEFENNYFDIVVEYGALHHINLKKAYYEIARVLSPDGKCICTEALGHNPIIHYYRKMTPHLRTKWEAEHILRKKDIEMAKSYFNRVEILGVFHLATIAAVPFRNLPVFNPILTFLETVDNIFLKLPILKWQAWQVVFILSEPKKAI
jgi:ubiquinone/menaquinone biosynthesis C-methylase UbiE